MAHPVVRRFWGLPRRHAWLSGEVSRFRYITRDARYRTYRLVRIQSILDGVPGGRVCGSIHSLGANYLLGVNGISLFLVLLTSFVTWFAVTVSQVRERPHAFYATLLGLEAALLGLFLAIDVLLFYMFWLVALVCLTFLIGVWGDGEGARSAKRLLVVAAGGSLLALAVILWCHHLYDVQSGAPSFNMRRWEGLVLAPRAEMGLFWALIVAFAVVIPLFPFHGWFLDSIERAPTPVSMLLGAAAVNVGIYGFWRFAFPGSLGPPTPMVAQFPLWRSSAVSSFMRIRARRARAQTFSCTCFHGGHESGCLWDSAARGLERKRSVVCLNSSWTQLWSFPFLGWTPIVNGGKRCHP